MLKIVSGFSAGFYLSGGTALSRFYYNHRYSDDLDFFLNGHPDFLGLQKEIIVLLREAGKGCGYSLVDSKLFSADDFMRVVIEGNGIELKIDFINDIAVHFGEILTNDIAGRLDNVRNILSNKISALYRLEVKDFVDVWVISKSLDFIWSEIMIEAKAKEPTVDPAELYNLFYSFPFQQLGFIKWASGFNCDNIESDFRIIANDILAGRRNSLT